MSTCPACGLVVVDGVTNCANCGESLGAASAPGDDPLALLGTTIGGKFELKELIGVGAMGTVYRADQTTLGRTVAVKILNAELTQDDAMVRRFHDEARAASRLNHPNAVAVIDFGQTHDGLLYLVMEFVRGRTLTEVLFQDFPLPQERLIDLMCQVLAGLHEAHSQGVIHQDVKPDNILVERLRTGGDLVKIADFGIARLRGDDSEQQQRTVAGTPEYMAPEQIRGHTVDARTDVYAAGVVLYEALTASRPFDGGQVEVLQAHLAQEPQEPHERRPDLAIPAAIETAVMRAMAKDPEERFSSAAEFRSMLASSISFVRPSGALCVACATQVPAGALFCPRCGVRLAMGGGGQGPLDPGAATIDAVGVSEAGEGAAAEEDAFPLELVGRDAELMEIQLALAKASRASVTVVAGRPGSGRSRLCAEAVSQATAAGYRAAVFAADPTGLGAPWFPVRSAVAMLLDLPPDVSRAALQAALQGLSPEFLDDLGGLCELFSLSPRVTGLELAVRRRECSAATVRVLRGSPSWRPTLFVFDDADRFDRPSQEILARLMDDPGDGPMHFLITCEEGCRLTSGSEDHLLTLGKLGADAVAEAVRGVSGVASGSEDWALRLGREIDGRPLHLEHALRFVLESGGDPGGLGLADVIGTRLDSLSQQARRTLQAAAIYGAETPMHLVTALVGSDRDTERGVDTLRGRGLLDRVEDRLVFAHPLIQDIVYEGIPAAARREFHARLHATLLKRGGAPPSVVGFHGYAAGGGDRVLANLERAGLDAQQAFDDAGAMMHFHRAWELSRWMLLRGDEEAEPVMARMGLVLGEAMRYAGDRVGAEGVLRETLDRCGAHDQAVAAKVWRNLAHLSDAGGSPRERAREHMRRALGLAIRHGDPALIAETYLDQSALLQRQGDPRAASDELNEGLLMITAGEGRRSDDAPAIIWRLLARLTELALAQGHIREAMENGEAALYQAERIGSPVGAARCHVLMGDVLAAVGKTQEAATHRLKAVEHMRDLGDRRSTAQLLIALAEDDLAAGAPEQARSRLMEAQKLAAAVQWGDGVRRSGDTLGTIKPTPS